MTLCLVFVKLANRFGCWKKMLLKKIIHIFFLITAAALLLSSAAAENDEIKTCPPVLINTPVTVLTESVIGNELGWVPSPYNRCHGFYIEAPFMEEDITNS